MTRCLSYLLLFISLVLSLPAQEEVRAVWVCAFGPWESDEAVRQMVRTCDDNGVNVILFQVRYRGDALHIPNRDHATYPNPEPPSPYRGDGDPLQVCLDEAHPRGIEVHAWVNHTILASRTRPEPTHPTNVHPDWMMHRLLQNGTVEPQLYQGREFWADPGNPTYQEHVFNICMDLVQNYDVDGLHFDRVRYPEGEGWPPRLYWGYHPASVAGFNRAVGRSGLPETNDPAWIQWRQNQITENLLRIAQGARTLRPNIVMSATPVTFDGLEGSETSVLQEWTEWVERGAIDVVVPQIYSRQTRGSDRAVVEWSAPYLARLAEINRTRARGPAQMWIGLRAWIDEGEEVYTGPEVAEKIAALRAVPNPPDGTALFWYVPAVQLGILSEVGRTVWAADSD